MLEVVHRLCREWITYAKLIVSLSRSEEEEYLRALNGLMVMSSFYAAHRALLFRCLTSSCLRQLQCASDEQRNDIPPKLPAVSSR